MGGILDLALNSKIINSDNISGFKNVTEDDEMKYINRQLPCSFIMPYRVCASIKRMQYTSREYTSRDDPICRPPVCLADLLKQRKKGHWKAADTVCKWDEGGFLTWTLGCKC
ncbi:hypothetical protein V1477_019419 [Vespula maculifrons]|uniref:Uncharacterized protein n=1 Tax=Vespula maculifrons TaxID=7453 RepID=A0ABD2ASI7_VESMC